jgi:electron-transferring-flavoprotein dehydrogenase
MAEHTHGNGVRPSQHQPPLPRERLIVPELPGEEAVPMDVVIVGGGPAGLACAIELARLAKETGDTLEIGVLEKAGQLGEHSLSGAVVNPRAFHELFPGVPDEELPFRRKVTGESVYMLTESRSLKIPTPPTMKNHGNWIASICEIVRWMGERAEAAGVNVFSGFPVDSLLVEGTRVMGVRTTPKGLDRGGNLVGPDAQPPMDLGARVTVLAEGTRGPLAQAWYQWQGIKAENPQIFALGVKELWETKAPLGEIVHTMGWPLPTDVFGGSFMYPLEDNLVAIGLVAGLDYKDARFDVHETFQRMKLHPVFRRHLEGGELLEWGAKTIPEGGFYSVPERRHGDGCVVVGDAAGYVDVPSLKGIHYAVHSGMLAARAIHQALRKDDVSQAALKPYTETVDASYVMSDLKSTRNMRLAFKHGFYGGGIRAGLMTITGGAFLGTKVDVLPDAAEPRKKGPRQEFTPDGKLTFSKVDAVFKSGNQTRDDIPSHLIVGQDVPPDLAELYVHMCPAGVYEKDGDKLVVNAPNCIDCKATDVLGPRWTPREGGSGPQYRRM